MNDTRYARDLGLLLSGNVTELVAKNQKKEISNVAEKFWRSSRNLRYIFSVSYTHLTLPTTPYV